MEGLTITVPLLVKHDVVGALGVPYGSIRATLPHRNREHQPAVRCAIYTYLSLRRLGREKVVSLRQRDMSSRSGRRYAGRQGGGTLGGPCAAQRGARGARVRTAP